MPAALRTALVSPSPLVLAGLKGGLQRRGDFEIVIAAESLQAALEESLAGAQVCIVDCAVDAGAQPLIEIGEQGPGLVLLGPGQDGPIADWLEAGISLLPHDAPIESIAIAAQAAAAGLVASTAQLTAEALRGRAGPRAVAGDSEPLTPREREVLLKMSLGLGNRQIAQALRISAHTAKFHVAQIIAKLDATSRAHAVAKAMRSGLVEL